MTEPTKKLDEGKARMDLFPWADVPVRNSGSTPVALVYEALKVWFHGAPLPLEISVPRDQVVGVCTVLGFGAAKYVRRGWEQGMAYSRVFAAAARHAEALAGGEILDGESGLPHQHHFWCNVVFLVTYAARKTPGATDDRPPAHPAVRAKLDQLNAFFNQTSGDSVMAPGPNPAGKHGVS